MSTLVQNVAKVKSAHDALSASIEAKGVSVPAGTKLTGMPALVDQIQTGGGGGEPTNSRAAFAGGDDIFITIPKTMIVDMTKITNLKNFFYGCLQLKSISFPPGFGQNAGNLQHCFSGCRNIDSLTLPEGFGHLATDANNCFYETVQLTSLSLPSGFCQNATNIQRCFATSNLPSLTLPEGFGQNATNMYGLFSYSTNLSSLTLPEGFGQNATQTGSMFDGCRNLTDIIGHPNFKVSFSLVQSPKLTHDSLLVVLNGVQTISTVQTLSLGKDNLAKLSDAEKQIATNKGWTLA